MTLTDIYSRTANLIGTPAVERLQTSRVAVFGVGGVGSYTAEALARAGVGSLTLIDGDTVAASNINRQLIALSCNIGQAKVEAAKARIAQINPDIRTTCHQTFFLPENAADFDFSAYDYVIDAVDTVTAKIALIEAANAAGTPIISCMGAGNKLDPTLFRVADIYSTSVCPLAKVMRRELKRRGISALKVVYSEEPPRTPLSGDPRTPASISFVPSVAGLIIAGEVIKDLIRDICQI